MLSTTLLRLCFAVFVIIITAERLKTVGVRLNASDKRLKVTCIRNSSVASSRSLTGVRTIATGSRCGAVDSRGELDGSGDAFYDRR